MDFVGSINGLVCLSTPPLGLIMILWNPGTKMWKQISPPKGEPDAGKIENVSVGFGYDSVSNDYKIVRIYSMKLKRNFDSNIYLYSTNAGFWREVEVNASMPLGMHNMRCNVIANGNPYWNALVQSPSDVTMFGEVLLTFDVRKENVWVWPLPWLKRKSMTSARLVNWKESVAVLVHSRAVFNKVVEVYTLDEEADVWCKIHIFGPIPIEVNRICQCFRNGEIAIEDEDGKLFLYDPDTNVATSLRIDDAQPHSYQAFSYVESLVAVKGMKEVGKEDAEASTSSDRRR